MVFNTFEAMGRKILVVDDEPSTVEILTKALAGRGYEVIGRTDPQEAFLDVNAEVGLILLDLTMPNLDGIAFCRKVKGMPEGARIPIVILTAADPKEKEWEALRAGAAAYLKKPVRLAALLEVIVKEFGLSDRDKAALLAEFKIRPKPKPPAGA